MLLATTGHTTGLQINRRTNKKGAGGQKSKNSVSHGVQWGYRVSGLLSL